jgi:hypothetical protein
MKRYAFILLVLLSAGAVRAQRYEKNILGVRAGVNVSTCAISIEDVRINTRLGAGVVWKRIYFGLGYDIGCLNLVKESDGEGTMRNNCFTISVGYNF